MSCHVIVYLFVSVNLSTCTEVHVSLLSITYWWGSHRGSRGEFHRCVVLSYVSYGSGGPGVGGGERITSMVRWVRTGRWGGANGVESPKIDYLSRRRIHSHHRRRCATGGEVVDRLLVPEPNIDGDRVEEHTVHVSRRCVIDDLVHLACFGLRHRRRIALVDLLEEVNARGEVE
jgi:hypothetical protein